MNTRHLAVLVTAVIALTALSCSCEPDNTRADAADNHDASHADLSEDADATLDSSDDDIVHEGDATPDGASDDADTTVSEDVTPDSRRLAEGITITDIEAFQTVESILVAARSPRQPDVPLVAGRDTLFRVSVETDAGWSARELTAELSLSDGTTLADSRTISGTSSVDDRSSAFEFRMDGEQLSPGAAASFRILGDGPISASTPDEADARWPADGSYMELEATDQSGTLHLVLVPFRYEGDGSGRMPDTSEEQLTIIEDMLRALYPASEWRLEVREAIVWERGVDFGDFNRELRSLKQADGATDAYYYGMIRPAESFADYCSGTCTTGQSFTVSSAGAASYRVGSGVGFSGERWAWTLAHELGHMHGRGHAPCGVSWWSDDDNYPNSGGTIGVRAWDGRTDTLLGPTEATDFMGYCDDLWASAYTYMGIFERMVAVSDRQQPMSLGPVTTWRYINWSDAQAPAWGRTTVESTPYSGEWAHAGFLDASGVLLSSKRVPRVRYAHAGERSVLIPPAPDGTTHVEVDDAERSFALPISNE